MNQPYIEKVQGELFLEWSDLNKDWHNPTSTHSNRANMNIVSIAGLEISQFSSEDLMKLNTTLQFRLIADNWLSIDQQCSVDVNFSQNDIRSIFFGIRK